MYLWLIAVQVQPEGGIARWAADLEMPVRLPLDPKQMPDTFVYLFRGEDSTLERVCYARLKTVDLVAQQFTAPAYWQP